MKNRSKSDARRRQIRAGREPRTDVEHGLPNIRGPWWMDHENKTAQDWGRLPGNVKGWPQGTRRATKKPEND